MRHPFGNPQPFFPERPTLGKRAQFTMTRGEVGQGLHRGQDNVPGLGKGHVRPASRCGRLPCCSL